MTDFLNSQFLDNTAQDWIIAAVLVLIVMVMVRTVIGVVLRRLSAIASKTETAVDDLVAELLEKTKFLFVALLALYTGSLSLTLTPEVDAVLSTTLVLGLLAQGALWANGIVNYMLGSWARQNSRPTPRSPRPSDRSASSLGSPSGPPSSCWPWPTWISTSGL